MDSEQKKSARTLLWSVLLSAPGPFVLGLGLTAGHSTTQLADFARRTSELLALLVSYALYLVTNRPGRMDAHRKSTIEREGTLFVGVIMCLSGLSIILFSFLAEREEKGNVIPALVIALLGAAVNIFFWRRYAGLHRKRENAILHVQARLYSAKSCVDLCVTATLGAVLLVPGSKLTYVLDFASSLLVSLYMICCGVKTIREQRT